MRQAGIRHQVPGCSSQAYLSITQAPRAGTSSQLRFKSPQAATHVLLQVSVVAGQQPQRLSHQPEAHQHRAHHVRVLDAQPTAVLQRVGEGGQSGRRCAQVSAEAWPMVDGIGIVYWQACAARPHQEPAVRSAAP